MDPVEVNIGDCTCAHSNGAVPHPDGDLVFMLPKASLDMAFGSQAALGLAGRYSGDNAAAFYSALIRHGAIGWNLVDIRGGSLPFGIEALIDRLENPITAAMIVKDKAHELYFDALLDPPQPGKSAPPRPSRRTGSTSRSRGSGRPTRRSPRPSSPSAEAAGS